jgi:hypothetical protein
LGRVAHAILRTMVPFLAMAKPNMAQDIRNLWPRLRFR